MTKAEFLSHPDVQAFVDWLPARFSGKFVHAYQDRRGGPMWRCESLFQAFTSYEWAGKDWAATKRLLDAFRSRLRRAVQAHDHSAAFDVCEDILKWGRVWTHNGRYLEKQRAVLVDELVFLAQVLQSEREPSANALYRISTEPDTECRMNAGFVKIYSVLLDHFLIYDGRVGAALGLLVRQFCESTQRPAIPEPLKFAYGSPKEAEDPRSPKNRNPSAGPYQFPRLRHDSRFHSIQAMRASWLIRAAEESKPAPFSPGEDGFHELASALFMVGYDLPSAPVGDAATAANAMAEEFVHAERVIVDADVLASITAEIVLGLSLDQSRYRDVPGVAEVWPRIMRDIAAIHARGGQVDLTNE